jgi:hypothetical protein
LGTFSATVDNVNVGAMTAFGTATALTNATSWILNLNGATDNAATAAVSVAPTFAGTTFSAGATGKISTSGVQDAWTINEKRILIWTVNGT